MSKTVLVVDDDVAFAQFLSTALTGAGWVVRTASSFADAASMLESPFAAFVFDVRLNAFNGLQLAHRVRQQNPDVTMVLVSGWEDPVLIREIEALGGTFLRKPLEASDLLSALERPPRRS